MWLYLLIFLIPVIFYYFPADKLNGNTKLLKIYIIFLAIFVGMSDMFGGYDRYIYGEAFDDIANITTVHGSYLTEEAWGFFPVEPGYTLLNILISFFTENRYIFILIITFLIYTTLFISLKRYAKNYPLAIILFLGLWFFFSFTYLRQVLGATTIWLSIRYIEKRKFWKFFLIFLIACSIHKSAVIFFPLYFIPRRKFRTKNIVIFMTIMLVIGLTPISGDLFQLYGDFSIFRSKINITTDYGFRIEYFLEALFFLFIIISRYKYISKTDSKELTMLNLSLAFCATLLFFVRSENGGRMSWYFILGIIVIMSNLATKGNYHKELATLLIAISLTLFVRIYVSWEENLFLYPYKTFITNGYRVGDPIHQQYEYDAEYDLNKFYRKPLRLDINI